jgi:hypothetical protein
VPDAHAVALHTAGDPAAQAAAQQKPPRQTPLGHWAFIVHAPPESATHIWVWHT